LLQLPTLKLKRTPGSVVVDENRLDGDVVDYDDDGVFMAYVEGSLASSFAVEPLTGVLPCDNDKGTTSEVSGPDVTDLAVLFRGRQKADAVLRIETRTRQWLYLLRGRLRLPLPAIHQATPRIVNK
jgi:hypothetical protein